MDSGAHSFLSSTLHDQIVFGKLKLKDEYPPPYKHIFWDYSRANKASINRAIDAIDYEELFVNKTMASKVYGLNDLLLNINLNYIPNKIILCEDKDPPWANKGIRTVIKRKNNAYGENIGSSMRHNYYVRLENITTELSDLIRDIKTEYHSKLVAKLANPSTSARHSGQF